jgi:hypothetical protein
MATIASNVAISDKLTISRCAGQSVMDREVVSCSTKKWCTSTLVTTTKVSMKFTLIGLIL